MGKMDGWTGSPLIRLEVCGSADFQSIHWESLELAYHRQLEEDDLSSHPRLLVLRTVKKESEEEKKEGNGEDTATKLVQPHRADMEPVPARGFNILMVTARPAGPDDLSPLICSQALLDAIEDAQKLSPGRDKDFVSVEVSRPGTWAAFQSLLISRTEEWHRQGGKGPWFDVVHFDLHGVIVRDRPYLLFSDPSGTKSHAKAPPPSPTFWHLAAFNSCSSTPADRP
ncbi:hypothetical protein B0T19DRAFT_438326 [Cercophora scortea]|uniref:Uncharacterized protein n=1 Tax=Cercophora scortea TaxID=314031 RepID=A0AAE0J6B8_9PEZI|nr:hypothetical protein B0T19DRAFT_438326 [Cercophora scortea]